MASLYLVSPEEFRRLLSVRDRSVQCHLFATLARINTLYMIQCAGSGHIGSSFSSLELVSWIWLNEMGIEWGNRLSWPQNIFFSSKGHDVPGLYAVLAAMGLIPFDMIHRLRRLDGLPGHPDISTPAIVTNTGSLGMGISKAKGFVTADRLAGRKRRIFVMTGDGELQEGQIWESLVSAVNNNMEELVVIVDNNGIQSDYSVEKTSALGDLEKKFSAFGWHAVRCDGHDTCMFEKIFMEVYETDGPSVIIADTIKGKGVSFMEEAAYNASERPYPYHSGALSPDEYEKAVSILKKRASRGFAEAGLGELKLKESAKPFYNVTIPAGYREHRLVDAYSEELVRLAGDNQDILALDADLRKDCGISEFAYRYPERFIECGIAEQDMISQAGALALAGMLPVVHSFACFLASRGCDQIYNNATEKTKIIYTSTLAGLLPGGPGHSHQSVRDVALVAHVPGLVVIEPASEHEVKKALEYAVMVNPGSTYLRLSSVPACLPPDFNADLPEEGTGSEIIRGNDAIMFVCGSVMLSNAIHASRMLDAEYGVKLCIINMPWLNRLDREWFYKMTRGYDVVFTLENHYVTGGFGSMAGMAMASYGYPGNKRLICLGVEDIPVCGQNDEVLEAHGLDAGSLVRIVNENL